MSIIKKLTKKHIKNFLKDIRNGSPFGWKLYCAGAFIYNNKVSLFLSYEGQGINEIVYNEAYDEIVYFDDILDKSEYNLKSAVDIATDEIDYMIDQAA